MFKSKKQIKIHSLNKYLWVLGHTATQYLSFQGYAGSIREGQSSPPTPIPPTPSTLPQRLLPPLPPPPHPSPPHPSQWKEQNAEPRQRTMGSPPFLRGSQPIIIVILEAQTAWELQPWVQVPCNQCGGTTSPCGSFYDCEKPSKITGWKLWKTTLSTHRSWEVHSTAQALPRGHGWRERAHSPEVLLL